MIGRDTSRHCQLKPAFRSDRYCRFPLDGKCQIRLIWKDDVVPRCMICGDLSSNSGDSDPLVIFSLFCKPFCTSRYDGFRTRHICNALHRVSANRHMHKTTSSICNSDRQQATNTALAFCTVGSQFLNPFRRSHSWPAHSCRERLPTVTAIPVQIPVSSLACSAV